jgi:E3 ubiquitin-protein ligase RNF19A
VDRKEIRARLTRDMFEKFNKFHHQALMSMNPDARWCPSPDCETVMVGSKRQPRLQCPSCKRAICFLCNNDWHTGSCELATKGLLGVAADRATFAAYALVSNVKPCPKCRSPIIKDEGCNHMTCQRCRYEFCWMCMGRYSEHHFEWWNVFGCPGGQSVWPWLGDDRCFCFNCSCGCGLAGMLKRLVLKSVGLGCGLACCPFIACFLLVKYACD